MTFDLPSPASRTQADLSSLKARLDARHYLPTLMKRLSAGLIQPDEATADHWASWIQSLQSDPAWPIIEPALDRPEAWPQCWRRARSAGFSPPTAHHQAIFFTRLVPVALEAQRFEVARRSWQRALQNWRSLGDSTYLREQLLIPFDLDEAQAHQVLASLLDTPANALETLGRQALRLQKWDQSPQRRSLRLAHQCFRDATDLLDSDSPSALESALAKSLHERHQAIFRAVADRYQQFLDNLDLTSVTTEAIVALLDGALIRHEQLNASPQLAEAILTHTLRTIWDLRELKRDEDMMLLPPLLERLIPLIEPWRSGQRDLPIELAGTVADVLVFSAEDALAIDARQEALEDALALCPGHRNASRLLSYLLLERAGRHLLKLSALPGATGRLDITRRALSGPLERAEEAVERAAALYPNNELLERYTQDLAEERRRFGFDLDSQPPPGDASPADGDNDGDTDDEQEAP